MAKKYERAMATIEFWKRFYEDQSKKFPDNPHMAEIRMAQKITLGDVLTDMKKIAES